MSLELGNIPADWNVEDTWEEQVPWPLSLHHASLVSTALLCLLLAKG